MHKTSCCSQKQEKVREEEEAKPATLPAENRPQEVNAPRDPPTLAVVLDMVNGAKDALDWKGVLRCESRMEDLLSKMREPSQAELLNVFITAFYNEAHFTKAKLLLERRALLLANMSRFTDQGMVLCQLGQCCDSLDDPVGSAAWFEKARKLAVEHAFFNAECAAYTLNPKP